MAQYLYCKRKIPNLIPPTTGFLGTIAKLSEFIDKNTYEILFDIDHNQYSKTYWEAYRYLRMLPPYAGLVWELGGERTDFSNLVNLVK